jgi:hypothetical protein
MNVVFPINGREAIPVRAIPYMAETTISADVLVRGFSRIDPTHSLYELSAHKLLDYGVPYPMAREEWRRFAVNLQALSDSLDRQVSNGELTLAEATAKWKRESVRVLPAGVFVWNDEFQTEHSRRFRRLSDDEIVANRAHWIEATTELIASSDDSYTAELMTANGMPENWRALLQDSIDEMAAEEPFNPRQFFVYAPKWSSAKDTDSPVDVTYDPMIDRDERAAVVEGFAGFLTDDETTDNVPMAHAEGSGELVRMLTRWFDNSLSDLPEKQRRYVDRYIPDWSELSALERRDCAIAADRKARESNAERMAQARSEQGDSTPDRWELRAIQSGFDKATKKHTGESDCESRIGKMNLSDERCRELASREALTIADWIEITGIGRGEHGKCLVKRKSISFVKWEKSLIAGFSPSEQADMERENETAPLIFPCTPARLIQFIDNLLVEIHAFSVPDAFRQAVTESTQMAEGAAHVSSDAPAKGAIAHVEKTSKMPATMMAPTDHIEQANTATSNVSEPHGQRAGEQEEILRKRDAFILEFERIWPSIARDLRDASRNGLSLVASDNKFGYWKVSPALNWAMQRGKLENKQAEQFVRANSESDISVLFRAMFKLK